MRKLLITSFPKHAVLSMALLALGAANAVAALSPGKIEVGVVSGKVNTTLGGGNLPLVQGAVLPGAGTTITSGPGSKAELYLANGAKVVLDPGTELQIRKFGIDQSGKVPESGFDRLSGEPSYSSTLLHVSRGKVTVEVVKLNVPVSEFKVVTPLVSTSVSGTVFSVEQGEDFARISCVAGGVAVQPRINIGAPVELGAGKSVVYRLNRKDKNVEGLFEKIQTISDLERGDVVGKIGGQEQDGDKNIVPEPEVVLVDNSLIIPLVSPNGEGQQP